MINHQTIIDWKLATLNGDISSELVLTDEMQLYLDKHPELLTELAFIDAFWQQGKYEMPTSEMDKRFYQMLSQAQAAQKNIVTDAKPVAKGKSGILAKLGELFTVAPVKPFAQVAALALVFIIGFNANDNNSQPEQLSADVGLSKLQQEVSSLSTMLALSMLEKSSAAERLTGVAYSQETGLTNPILMKTLMTTLANDRSTAVKLAIINTFSTLSDITEYEPTLLTLIENEQNTLVKIELSSLLLNVGSQQTQSQLIRQLNASTLSPDMAEFLKKVNAITHI